MATTPTTQARTMLCLKVKRNNRASSSEVRPVAAQATAMLASEIILPITILLRQSAKSAPEAFAHIADELEPVPLDRWACLCGARERRRWVYFPESGVVSLVGTTAEGES